MRLLVKYDNDEVAKRCQLKYARPGDCGIDLYNAEGRPITVVPRSSVMISAGIRVKIPDGYAGFVRARSSTFKRRGLFVVEGIIDSGYVGPIFVHVWNPGLNGQLSPVVIEPWARLSQLIILPAPQMDIVVVDELPRTERGERGFGSTGL